MITLQYFNGTHWVFVGKFSSERGAWMALGGDDVNYRTIGSETGETLTCKKAS